MAATIGTPSPAHNALRVQTLPKAHHKTQPSLKKVSFSEVSIKSNSKAHLRRRRSLTLIASAARNNETSLDSKLGVEEDDVPRSVERDESNSTVHLGRRMLLGSAFAAITLSNFNKPGWATTTPEATISGDDRAKAEGGDSLENGTTTTSEESGPVDEKWKLSRVYDASVLGEPSAVSGDRSKVWEKLLQARVVYLGEAERVPDPDDRVRMSFLL